MRVDQLCRFSIITHRLLYRATLRLYPPLLLVYRRLFQYIVNFSSYIVFSTKYGNLLSSLLPHISLLMLYICHNFVYNKNITIRRGKFMRSERKPKKSKRWLKITGIILLLLIVCAGAYTYSVYHSLTNAVDTMHQPIEREKSENGRKTLRSRNRILFQSSCWGLMSVKGIAGALTR